MPDKETETPEPKTTAAEPADPVAQPDGGGEPGPAAEAAEAEGSVAEAEPEPAADAGGEAEQLRAEVGTLKDQLLRALAETDNLRRRSQRERTDALRYAPAPLAKDLIGVADNLGRALESVPAEAVEQNEHLKSLVDGLRLVEKELLAAFERNNITKLEPFGEKLDPHFHEAMFEMPDPTQAPGTVVQVMQAGYVLHDRLLRPARVGVAKAVDGAVSGAGDQTAPEPGSKIDTTA